MKILIIVSVVSALLLVAACGNSTSGPSSSEDWFPLTVGNWWLYQVDGFSIEEADTLAFSGTIVKRITSLQGHADGFQVYELRSISEIAHICSDTTLTLTDTSFVYLQQTAEELKEYRSTTSSAYSVTMIKFPVTPYETWFSPDSFPYEFEVTGFNKFVHVPSGGFTNCAVITESYEPYFIFERIYHQGTGLVETIIFDSYVASNLTATQSLQSYNVQQNSKVEIR